MENVIDFYLTNCKRETPCWQLMFASRYWHIDEVEMIRVCLHCMYFKGVV